MKGLSYFNMAQGAQLVRQKCLLVLSTRRGSQMHRRGFGSDLHLRVFEPNDEVLRRLIEHDVRDALAEHVPEVEVLDDDGVAFDPVDYFHRLRYTVRYRIRSSGQVDSFTSDLKLER